MSFFKFAFSFLYVRDWNTGKMELSRPRVTLLCAGIFLLILALTIITVLQASVEYVSP
ncbi:hypothetical protein H6784_00185 [Candidatus Nomurabacteria bacterium]|nr:hypothetical protein [Candidatus Kaiserbacteria bacterium]MCB9813811.1 hypothetical protein [Candidatus Nomurabacteria bacterium]